MHVFGGRSAVWNTKAVVSGTSCIQLVLGGNAATTTPTISLIAPHGAPLKNGYK